MSEYQEKKAITSFVQEKVIGQNTVKVDANQNRDLKDEDLMSGRHSNNLQPVIFSSPENEEGGRIKLDFDTQTSVKDQNIDKLVQSSYISRDNNTYHENSNMVKNSNSELGGHSQSYMELNFQAKFNGELTQEPGSALISRADNQTRQGMRDPTITTNPQIVQRSMVPMKKREPSHKELMEQIERNGALSKQSRQRSLSRDPSRLGTNSVSREQYRSPSAFMHQAEMAAEAYAKLGDQEVVNLIAIGSSTGLLDNRANSQRSTLQAASPNPGSPRRLISGNDTKHVRGLTSQNPLIIPKDSTLTNRSSHGTFGVKTFTRNSQIPPTNNKRGQQRSIHGTDILSMSQTQQNLNKLRMSKVSTGNLQIMAQMNHEQMSRGSNFGLGIEGNNISKPKNQKFFQIKSQSSLKRYKHYINPQNELSSETKDYSHLTNSKTGDILSAHNANIKQIESTANKSSNINRDLEGMGKAGERHMSVDKQRRSQQGQVPSRNHVGYQSHQNFRYSRGRIAHTSEQRFRSNKRTQKTTHVVSQETFQNTPSNVQAQDYIYTSNNFLSKPLSIQGAEPATSLIIQSAESQDRGSSPPDFIRITNNNGNQNNMSPKTNTHIILKAHGAGVKNAARQAKNSDLSLNDTDQMLQTHDFRVQGKNVHDLQDTVITSAVEQITPKNLEIETNRDLFYMQRETHKPDDRNIQGSPLHKLNQDLKKVQPNKDRQIEKLKSLVQSSNKTTPGTQNITDDNLAPVAAIKIGSHRLQKETNPEEQKAKFHNDRLKNPNISFQKDIVGSFERYEQREERSTRMGQPKEKKVVQQRQYLPIQKLQLMNIQANGQMVNEPSVAVQADLSSTQNALSSCTASFRFLSQRQRKKELKLNFDQFQPRIIAKPSQSRSPNNRTPSRQHNVPDTTTYQELSQMQAPETDPLVDTTHSQPSQFGGKESRYLANQKQIQAKKQVLYGTQFTQNAIQKENLKRSQQTTQNLSPDLIAIDDDMVVNKVDMNLNANTFSNTSYIRRSISVNQNQTGDSSSSQMKAINQMNRSPNLQPTTIILKKNQGKDRQQSVKTVLHVKNGFAKVDSQENDDGPDSEIHHMQIVESKIDLPQMQKVNISRQYRVIQGPLGGTQKIEFNDGPFNQLGVDGRNDQNKVKQENTFSSNIEGNKSLIGIKQTNVSQPNLHDTKRRSKSGLDRASVETKTAENGPTTLHSQEGAQSKMTTQKILDSGTNHGSMARIKPQEGSICTPMDKSPKEGEIPLKSVHEKEELDLLQMRKGQKEEAELRKRSREQFHERQKDLAERKKSKVQKPKGKIMVNPHLMSSPMQTLGKVSMINKRQEAIMNERTQEDRDDYLTNMISLRDDPEKDKRDKEVAAALSFRSPPATDRSVRAHHKEQLARSQVSRGGKARDYEKMDVSPTILNKLHRQLQYRKNLSHAIKNNQNIEDPALMDVESQISQPDVFKPELIQTSADEVVFSRINPHLLQQRTTVNIKDQSLYKLLEQNGGIPLSPKENELPGKRKSAFEGKKGKPKKPYREMNDFQKQTYDFILKCRREIKAETIQATLTQYIKENKDEEKLNEFCQELMATQKAKKDKADSKFKKQNQEMTAAERAREKRNNHGKKSLTNVNCPNSEILSLTSEPSCPGSKISPQKRALYEKQPTKEINQQIVDTYDQEKIVEKAQKLQKEEDDQQFSGMSKQKKDTRFSLTKQERERILEKLDNIWKLELKQEEARQEFKIAYEKARLEKFRKYDIDYYFKMKKIKKLESINQRIVNHKNKAQAKDQEEEVEQVEDDAPPIWKYDQNVAFDEAVILNQPEIDFENLRNKKKTEKIRGDPNGIINRFSQNDFTEEDELAYTEAMRQEYALGIPLENLSDDSVQIEVDNDFEDDLAFFKEFWINYRHKQDKLDRKLGKTSLFKWAPNTPRDNKGRRPGMSTGSRQTESPASKNRSNASPTNAMRELKQISEKDNDQASQQDDESEDIAVKKITLQDEIKIELASSSSDEDIKIKQSSVKHKEEISSSAFLTEIGLNKKVNNAYFKMRNSTSVLPPVTYSQDLKESILDKKYKMVPNNKLRQTQIANQRHMQNIQNNRHSSVGKWGVRKNNMMESQTNLRDSKMNLTAKSFAPRNGLQSTKNLQTNNPMRQSLLNLARDCHNELLDPGYDQLRELKKAVQLTQPSKDRPKIQKKKVSRPKQAKVTAPVANAENKAFRKYDKKIEGIREKQQDFIKNLDKFYENREKVRTYEAEDDYHDILIENIKQEQAYIEEDEAQVAESVRNEMIEQRDLKKRLRQMYVNAMKEMM